MTLYSLFLYINCKWHKKRILEAVLAKIQDYISSDKNLGDTPPPIGPEEGNYGGRLI